MIWDANSLVYVLIYWGMQMMMMMLLAPSWMALQKPIDLALTEAIKIEMFCFFFNSKEIKCMIIKPQYAGQQFLDHLSWMVLN